MADGGTEAEQDTLETQSIEVRPVGQPVDGRPAHRQTAHDSNGSASAGTVQAHGPASDGAAPGGAVDGKVEGSTADDPDLDAEDDELAATEFGSADDEIVVNYEDRIIAALPDLARLTAVAWTRTAAWGFGAGLRVGARLARASVDPQAASELANGVSTGMRSYAREFLGISDLEDRLDALTPAGDRFAGPRGGELTRGESRAPKVSPEVQLRAQGAELLRQSADVSSDDALHPAFGRILAELAPDEGRILRLLSEEGPQPVVDVRAANLIGVGSQLVSQNLNMVAMQAGCRHADRVPAYLINLQRLGLASFADEPLQDAITYQVLEAQPHVLHTIQATSRAKTIHRSLRLTPFGAEFCEACFASEPDPMQEPAGGDSDDSAVQ